VHDNNAYGEHKNIIIRTLSSLLSTVMLPLCTTRWCIQLTNHRSIKKQILSSTAVFI